MTFDDRVNWFPHPSPNGDAIVYLSYCPGTQGHPAYQQVELRLLEEGFKPAKVLRSLFGGQGTINVGSWAPSGREFAFVEYPIAGGLDHSDASVSA